MLDGIKATTLTALDRKVAKASMSWVVENGSLPMPYLPSAPPSRRISKGNYDAYVDHC